MSVKPTIIPAPSTDKYPTRGGFTPRQRTTRIIWHCWASPEGQHRDFADLYQIHYVQNGWNWPGYHFLIHLDGTIQECRPHGVMGAGVSGHNNDTVHICYVGGMEKDMSKPKDTRTIQQTTSLYRLTAWLLDVYSLDWDDVHGHNEYAAKACPSFDVKADINAQRSSFEGGDPEPDMPENGPMGAILDDLLKRVDALEKWRKS